MNEIFELFVDEASSAWRFRWWALVTATVMSLIGWSIVFAMPDRYEANARVFVDTRTALKPALQGLTVDQDVGPQLNFVQQSLIAGPQLKIIAERSGILSKAIIDEREQAKILQAFANRIVLSVRSANERESDRDAGAIYGISYQDGDRLRGLRVVQTLLDTLITETLGGKREGSQNAQKFLETQISEVEHRLSAAEDKLAAFKKGNIGLMPTEQGGYFFQLQTEIDAVKKLETALSVAVSRRAELSRQMRGESVIAAAGTASIPGIAGAVASGGDTVSRIKEAQNRLDELLLRFTEKHPDVIAARQTITELQRRREAEIESLRRGDANAVATSGAAGNPVYQSIQLALNQTDVEIASIRGEMAQHAGKASELRKRLDSAPQVEAEYAQLNRDYDVNKAQYTALLASYQKARLGEQADNAGSVRFEIVQPPIASFQPVFPKRGLFLTGVLVGAVILGCGVAYLMHLFRPVITSVRGLAGFTGLNVLGVVSPAFPDRLRNDARRDIITFATAAVALFCVFGLVFILNRTGYRLTVFGSVLG